MLPSPARLITNGCHLRSDCGERGTEVVGRGWEAALGGSTAAGGGGAAAAEAWKGVWRLHAQSLSRQAMLRTRTE